MKRAGLALFILGALLVAVMLIWGWTGFRSSAVPVLILLGGTGVALMAVGSRMNKDKDPNKAVQWQPAPIKPFAASNESDGPFDVGRVVVAPESQNLAARPVDFVPWALVARNGARYQLASTTIVGRDPGMDRGESGYAIAVTDADSSMSKVHAVVTVSGDTLLVRDMGSANGTVVVTSEGIEQECAPNQEVVITDGSTIQLGNCALVVGAHPAPGGTMNCPSCGNPARVGVAFCGECGFTLPMIVAAASPPPPPPPPPPTRTPTRTPTPSPEPAVQAPEATANPFMISAPPGAITPPPQAESSSEIEATRVSNRRRSSGSWSLTLSDGQRHTVGAAALIGRDATADPRWSGASRISVVDSTKTVSKTHALFETDATGLWVTDLHSSNGVYVELPDGREIDVEPGARTSVPAGSTVLLGDFAVTVEKS